MTNIRRMILDEIIQDLLGTCQVMDNVASSHGIAELTFEDIRYIESEIFLCESCGWWCDVCEHHGETGESLCDDCFDATDIED